MSGYFYTEKPSETDFSLVEKVIPFVKQFKEVTKYAVSFKKNVFLWIATFYSRF